MEQDVILELGTNAHLRAGHPAGGARGRRTAPALGSLTTQAPCRPLPGALGSQIQRKTSGLFPSCQHHVAHLVPSHSPFPRGCMQNPRPGRVL